MLIFNILGLFHNFMVQMYEMFLLLLHEYIKEMLP